VLDWRAAVPFYDRMLGELRRLDINQRAVAQDLASTLLPRTARFYSAVAILTLGRDREIATAVRNMTPAVMRLVEAITADRRKYDRERDLAQKALAEFRSAADKRNR
jgi:hypothetical protein